MAVDTRDKRMSMITLASPVPMVLPNPDGSFSAADRSMLLWLYHGITLSGAGIPDKAIFKGMFKGMAKGLQYPYS